MMIARTANKIQPIVFPDIRLRFSIVAPFNYEDKNPKVEDMHLYFITNTYVG